jgi:alkanesulfonate monooxygenase SsuD/methylene tetrahydromethanopterin reductase-like flavin-dependent oxidoreductase (luciferase family)
MHIAYFTERPYRGLSEEEVLANGAYFGISNARHDAQLASDDHHHYLDEMLYAEEVGFDAIGLNEHHGTSYCMGSVVNIEAAILARITQQVKIYLIGNPVTAHRNPLRLAEELAEIDLISRGRLVTGWVRGSGSEQFFNNVNPAYNREMFEEAHDFIVRAWSEPGPWRYEGKHFHYRHVNPWALPFQKPIPATIIPGVLSVETAMWAADHSYPYLGLTSALGPTAELWNLYADTYAKRGLQAGPENFGYVTRLFVADTEEEAQELGRSFCFAGAPGSFAKAQHTLPAGYNSPESIQRLSARPGGGFLGIDAAKLRDAGVDPADVDMAVERAKIQRSFDAQQKETTIIVGTPDSVLAKMKASMRLLRPGVYFLMNVQGKLTHQQRRRSIQLIGEHILPELRAYAKELDLPSMFDRKPGSVPLDPSQPRHRVVDLDALEELHSL